MPTLMHYIYPKATGVWRLVSDLRRGLSNPEAQLSCRRKPWIIRAGGGNTSGGFSQEDASIAINGNVPTEDFLLMRLVL